MSYTYSCAKWSIDNFFKMWYNYTIGGKMTKNSEKIIKDRKMIYLIKTLSRTRRKDYENFVINSIWNKLDNKDIEIVSQQYIFNPKDKRKHYFIDLYFPTLKIGIECDEAHHLNEKNIYNDKIREISIYDALHQIDNTGYISRHIDVTQSFSDVQSKIEETVLFIKHKIAEINPPKWEVLSEEEYFANRNIISINDRIGFKTINKTCNILFSTKYKESEISGKSGGKRPSYFTPNTFKNTEYDGYKVWFPKLAVYDENNNLIAATDKGWNNQLLNEGKELVEKNDKIELTDKHDKKVRIVFAKYKDPLGDNAYKFVGIFKLNKIDNDGKRYYDRIDVKCKLLK